MSYFEKKALLCALCCGFVLPSISIIAKEHTTVEEAVELVEQAPTVYDVIEPVVELVEQAPIAEDVDVIELVVEEVELAPVTEEVVVIIPEEMSIDFDIPEPVVEIVQEPEGKPESLLKKRPAIFSLGTFLSIDTVGDPGNTHVKTINKPLGQITTFKLEKDKFAQERGKWDAVTVLRRTKYVYAANLKFDTKYVGCRETILSKTLEGLLGLRKRFTGTVLLDEYKNYPLWNVTLRDIVELRSFLTYLEDCLAQRGHRTFDEKPVIRLILEEDVLLKTLDAEDVARLNILFDVVNPNDFKTVKFFDDLQFDMDGVIRHLSTSKPIEVKLGFRQNVLNALDGTFYDFDYSEFVPKFIIGTTAVIGAGIITYFVGKAVKHITNTKPVKELTDAIFGEKPPTKVELLLTELIDLSKNTELKEYDNGEEVNTEYTGY